MQKKEFQLNDRIILKEHNSGIETTHLLYIDEIYSGSDTYNIAEDDLKKYKPIAQIMNTNRFEICDVAYVSKKNKDVEFVYKGKDYICKVIF